METIPFAASTTGSFGGDSSKKGRRRRQPAVRPPAVDSTLLRFVSQQQERLVRPKQDMDDNDTAAAATQPPPPNGSSSGMPSSTKRSRSGGTGATTTTTSSSSTEEAPATTTAVNGSSSSILGTTADPWWWGQFNSHRIVSVLMERDAELGADVAEKAGQAVQSQALARKVRRQIRSFLRERDQALLLGQFNVQQQQQQQQSLQTSNGISDGSTLSSSSQQQQQQLLLHTFEESVNVMLELGLTIKDVAEILEHTPGVALMRPRGDNGQGETLETTLTRVLNLLTKTLKLRKYHARKVIRACPGLLTMRRSQAAEQIILIMSKLGVSAKALGRDLPALCLLILRPPAAVFRLVSFLASDAIRMPVKNIGPLLRRRECRELLDRVAPVPSREILMSSDEEEDDNGIIDAVDPTVASALWGRESINRRERIEETYRGMSKTAWTLRHEIGTKDLGKVIAAYPSVLLLDAQETVLPNANYLMNDLGIWEDDLPKVLQLYPVLLGHDLDRMKGIANYMLALEVPEENLGNMFRSFPHLLTLDVEKDMDPVVEFLRSIGINNMGRFVSRLPSILGYSVNRDLLPKWNYLAGVCADPRFEVTKFPAFFSYPSERIRSRYEYLRRVKGVPTQFLALDQIMSFGDKDFATKVVGDADGGQAFLLFCDGRKKEGKAALSEKKRKRRTMARKPTANEVPIESSRR